MTTTSDVNLPSTEYIDSNAKLQSTFDRLSQETVIGFDSEFVRVSTFYPKPGLYQLSASYGVFLIDPLSITDWTPMITLFKNPDITIVMHSCGEDLALLQHCLQVKPARLFDTQLAAAYCGHGYSISYQGLVQSTLNIALGKGETRSDWIHRPLTDAQLHYAAQDVNFLIPLFGQLTDKLNELGRRQWLLEDCEQLLESAAADGAELQWQQAYQLIKGAWRLPDYALANLQKLCYWREKTAREKDLPKNWVVKDQDLLELVTKLAYQDQYELDDIVGLDVLNPKSLNRVGRPLISCLNSQFNFELKAESSELDKPLDSINRNKIKKLQNLTKNIAEKMDLPPELLARKRQWVKFISSNQNDNRSQKNSWIWPTGFTSWRQAALVDAVASVMDAAPGKS